VVQRERNKVDWVDVDWALNSKVQITRKLLFKQTGLLSGTPEIIYLPTTANCSQVYRCNTLFSKLDHDKILTNEKRHHIGMAKDNIYPGQGCPNQIGCSTPIVKMDPKE
jgi:hypothetical protein